MYFSTKNNSVFDCFPSNMPKLTKVIFLKPFWYLCSIHLSLTSISGVFFCQFPENQGKKSFMLSWSPPFCRQYEALQVMLVLILDPFFIIALTLEKVTMDVKADFYMAIGNRSPWWLLSGFSLGFSKGGSLNTLILKIRRPDHWSLGSKLKTEGKFFRVKETPLNRNETVSLTSSAFQNGKWASECISLKVCCCVNV